MTKLLGVIGDPIAHSLSPLIHNAWLRDYAIPATYEAMHVPKGAFPEALQSLAQRDILGVNVTLPHKGEAFRMAQTATDATQVVGAANTLTYKAGTWHADNTDVPGFLTALQDALGGETLESYNFLILGAGGSARAAVYAIQKTGAKLTILNRTIERAKALSAELTDGSALHGSIEQCTDYIDAQTIVVNTTSLGLQGEILELPESQGSVFFDLSYGTFAAAQLQHAQNQGWQVADGLGMLVAQAAESFELWFDLKPDRQKALHRCRIALEAVT